MARRRDVPHAPLVVVKRILAEHAANPGFVASFVDEAHVTASLHHEAIAQTINRGRTELQVTAKGPRDRRSP